MSRTTFRWRSWPMTAGSGCAPCNGGRPRTGGYTNLDGAPRADTGSHRLPADLITMIEALALSRPRPTIATLHRTVAGICGQRGWPVPSYGVVRSIVRALDPGMVTLALEGPASYRDKYELALRRQADRPNAMWQSDHTMLDIVVVGADGEPVRPWLTTIQDTAHAPSAGTPSSSAPPRR